MGLRSRTQGMRIGAIAAVALAASTLLSACEDQGNPGDDSVLSGGSLVVVLVLVVLVVGAFMLARSRRR